MPRPRTAERANEIREIIAKLQEVLAMIAMAQETLLDLVEFDDYSAWAPPLPRAHQELRAIDNSIKSHIDGAQEWLGDFDEENPQLQ